MRVSLNAKILAIVLSFIVLVGVVFAVYIRGTTENYRALRVQEVVATVRYESERVNKTIARYERNALDLANTGAGYLSGSDRTEALGERLTLDNFRSFPEAAGGGIWFEPFAFDPARERYCFYAFSDTAGARVVDPSFRSPSYDYHNQSWYTKIKEASAGKRNLAVWTAPYLDNAGTFSLMTTVGAGIYTGDGALAGMSTVDWPIQRVIDDLSQIKPTETSFVVLASPADDYILTHTQTEQTARDLVGRAFSSLPWREQATVEAGGQIGQSRLVVDGQAHLCVSRSLDNGMALLVLIPENEIFAEVEARNVRAVRALLAASLLVVVLVLAALTFLIRRPLRRIMRSAQAIGAGDLNQRIDIRSHDEIGQLAHTFNQMTADLKQHIEESRREYADKMRIRGELNVATLIQSSLLPLSIPHGASITDFDVVARMYPAREVGGDFYDFFLVDKTRLAVVIADVSDKGVPAALFMVVAKALLKNQAQMGKPPAEAFFAVNNQLCENNNACMFVTCFMGILDIETGRLTYANAGHLPPLVRRGGTYAKLQLPPGFVLGGIENTRYLERETTLAPGDILFLYTDGVSEATNPTMGMVTDAGVRQLCDRFSNDSIHDLLRHLKAEIDTFADGAEQSDDITMLALAYFGVANASGELTVLARIPYLEAAQDMAEKQMHNAGFPGKDITAVRIAIEEIFVNISQYAYGGDGGEVTIRCEVAGDRATVTFEDSGAEYNPLARETPNVTLDASQRDIGGLGIHMVKKMMDEAAYRHENGRNVLTIVRRRHA